ncbi:DinB family protein [Paenibacillus sp. UNC451MF]|uniref:DinB family protein n=1 Tax=Paenibacillus sp. UNC451MF TaxID=1449063 RepID=UPI00048EAF73|nr:DinB family protein [Paenibacillus sp. UNC451MF]
MFVTIQSFIEDYRHEAATTQKLLDALTDESLSQEVAPGYRTLGHLAWHLVPSGGILNPTGLRFEAPAERSEPPASAAAIAEAYRRTTQSLLEAVETQWTDDTLQVSNSIFGQQWKNGLTLNLFLRHEIHHRGQLTILMRQAGVPVTGVYGPTKEEWAAIGMEAPV